MKTKTINNKQLLEKLTEIGPIGETETAWIGKKSLAEAYKTCQQPGWMLWFAMKMGVSIQKMIPAACACARLSLDGVEKGEESPLKAIKMAEAWSNGRATADEVRDAFVAAASYFRDSYVSCAGAFAHTFDDAYGWAFFCINSAAPSALAFVCAYAYALFVGYSVIYESREKNKMRIKCADAIRKCIKLEDLIRLF